MPISLSFDDLQFAQRVQSYCERGLSEPAMAKSEGINLTRFRDRLFRAGLKVDKATTRRLVRTGSRELFAELLAAGQVEVAA